MVKMSSESKKMKPKTDFDLILNYSNQYNWKRLKNESSAGANAAYKADKTISATDPLSEIVWSPDNGFSLKCVDSSFTNKTTSLFRDVEPSSMVLALLQSVTCDSSTTDKPTDDVFVEPLAVICTKSDVSSTDTPARHPTSDSVVLTPEYKAYEEHDTGSDDNMEKMNTERGTPDLPNGQKENLMNHWEKNNCDQANIEAAKISEIMQNKYTISGKVDQRPVGNLLLQVDKSKPNMEQNPSSRKHCKEGMDTGVGNQVVEIEDDLHIRAEHMIEDKGSGAQGTNLISSGISHSNKLELTAEDDLQTFNCGATSAARSRVLVSTFNENKNKSQVNEMMLPYNKNLPVMHSTYSGIFHMERNENEQKSLSDGNSKKENCSHLSCESCHSTTKLFLSSRKRCKQEVQEVIIGSKKVRKQIQETSYSKSFVKRDSSFMNLISNIMKGYSQSSQDEEKSLPLVHENPDRHLLWPDQKPLTCGKDQDLDLKNSFKSNFQSMYCRSFENVGTKMSHQVGETSKENNCKVEETREQFADIQLLSEAKASQNCCINKEASTGLKDEKGNSDHTSKHKFNHVTPFPRLRDSEPMVSMFARRLGAIKQCQHTE